jgi:hypothetical protein
MTEAGKAMLGDYRAWFPHRDSWAFEKGILAIEAEAIATERARYTPEAFAKALTRGAHNNADYETEEGEPCDWCRLAGEQAAAAVLRIVDGAE